MVECTIEREKRKGVRGVERVKLKRKDGKKKKRKSVELKLKKKLITVRKREERL